MLSMAAFAHASTWLPGEWRVEADPVMAINPAVSFGVAAINRCSGVLEPGGTPAFAGCPATDARSAVGTQQRSGWAVRLSPLLGRFAVRLSLGNAPRVTVAH